ncbi:MAG: hypothetical protein ACE3JQ_05140 [Paenisporosarcina sp.]
MGNSRFFYILGLSYLRNQKFLAALDYTSKALFYYNREFIYFRAIECHINIAVSYKNSLKFSLAFENLLLAEKVSYQVNNIQNLSIIYINLANLYAETYNSEQAIIYYKKSMNIAHDSRVKLTSIYCIALENSKINNLQEVLKWVTLGLKMYEKKPEVALKGLYHHFKCLLAKNSSDEDFVDIINYSITHFVEEKDYRHAYRYSFLLANYYKDHKKYKKAATYFSLANGYLEKKEKRKYVEDI